MRRDKAAISPPTSADPNAPSPRPAGAVTPRRRFLTPRRTAILRAIDGRAEGSLEQVAEHLGMSIGVLRREMASLKAANLVRVVTVLNVSRLARTLECVTRLKVDWRADQAITAMERRLIDHPDVLNVALVAGAFDYVVESRHADKHAAAEFARALRADPAVTGLHIDHVRTRFRRLG